MTRKPEPVLGEAIASGAGAEAERGRLIDLLRSNRGFDNPEEWVEYAAEHGFRPVRATTLADCPFCGSPASSPLGQYVYYSTLARLLTCQSCGLVYSDTRIDPGLVRSHFETVYKDPEYFARRRRRIFEQLARLMDHHAPRGGRVLDVGGATGEQMALLQRRRPDLELTIADLSQGACREAESRHGFRTVCASIGGLAVLAEHYDVVLLSDVIYYEADVAMLWATLLALVSHTGAAIIRVPNRLALIRAAHRVSRLGPARRARVRDRIPFFNPEHLFVFSRSFLTARLRDAGFDRITFQPSPLLAAGTIDTPAILYEAFARATHVLSGGRVVATPSMVVTAVRGPVRWRGTGAPGTVAAS